MVPASTEIVMLIVDDDDGNGNAAKGKKKSKRMEEKERNASDASIGNGSEGDTTVEQLLWSLLSA